MTTAGLTTAALTTASLAGSAWAAASWLWRDGLNSSGAASVGAMVATWITGAEPPAIGTTTTGDPGIGPPWGCSLASASAAEAKASGSLARPCRRSE